MKTKRKIAWITGGGTGIGKSLAIMLSKNNWKVVISGRRVAKLNEVKSFNPKNISVQILDIGSEKDCRKAVKRIESNYGFIDLVILNAAAYNPGRLDFEKLDIIKNVININLNGQINCLGACLPTMKKKKSGHVVFVSSPAGFRGLPNAGIYGVTKSALTFLSECLYLELKRYNIKVQVVLPGFIKTPMTDKNDFPMPFLMTADKAAAIIIENLNTERFEISFPKRLILTMKIMNVLPHRLYFFLINKFLGKF